MGDTFASWVRMLYTHPRASVFTNFNRSSQFRLYRGTRQGCPLSPLLFAVKPLALAIKKNPLILAPNIGRINHISLYADYIILYLRNPEQSIPPLLNLLKTFGKLSGYSLNWQKSEFLAVTNNIDPIFMRSLPFKKAINSLKYLGVNIPRNPKEIYKLNYLNMIDNLKSNIKCWRTLPLSMMGCVMVYWY